MNTSSFGTMANSLFNTTPHDMGDIADGIKKQFDIDINNSSGVGQFIEVILKPAREALNYINAALRKAGSFVKDKILPKFKTTEQNRSENKKAIRNAAVDLANSKTDEERQKAQNRLTGAQQKEGFYQNLENTRNKVQKVKDATTGTMRSKEIPQYGNTNPTSYFLQNDRVYRKELDDKGNEIHVPLSQKDIINLPRNIRRSLGFESTDSEEIIDAHYIRESLGENYTVEVCENGEALNITFIGENAEDDIFNVIEKEEDEEISIQESIFGVDSSEEEITESYSDIEKELLELESIFE